METHSGDEFSLPSPAYPHEAEGHLQVEKYDEQRLELYVIYTDTPGTRAALQMADELGNKLGAQIKLLVPWEVPYTLSLTKPAVSVEFLERQVRNLAGNARLEIAAHIYLCRDKRQALKFLLRPNSLIAVGGKKRWWPTAAQKLTRDLEKDGHHVIFAELR